MIEWRGRGGGGNAKQRGQEKLAPLCLIQQMHVATHHIKLTQIIRP
jgi:hypothetical protein